MADNIENLNGGPNNNETPEIKYIGLDFNNSILANIKRAKPGFFVTGGVDVLAPHVNFSTDSQNITMPASSFSESSQHFTTPNLFGLEGVFTAGYIANNKKTTALLTATARANQRLTLNVSNDPYWASSRMGQPKVDMSQNLTPDGWQNDSQAASANLEILHQKSRNLSIGVATHIAYEHSAYDTNTSIGTTSNASSRVDTERYAGQVGLAVVTTHKSKVKGQPQLMRFNTGMGVYKDTMHGDPSMEISRQNINTAPKIGIFAQYAKQYPINDHFAVETAAGSTYTHENLNPQLNSWLGLSAVLHYQNEDNGISGSTKFSLVKAFGNAALDHSITFAGSIYLNLFGNKKVTAPKPIPDIQVKPEEVIANPF